MDKEISKDISEFSTPAVKVLVRILIAAVVVIFSILYLRNKQDRQDCKDSIRELTLKNDSLHVKIEILESATRTLKEINDTQKDSEIIHLKMNKEYLDKIAHELKKAIHKK